MTLYGKTTSVRHRRAGRIFLCLAALIASGCSQQPVRLFGEAQGTYYSIQYYDRRGRDLQPQVDSLLHAFDLTASLWVDSSLLRRLNAGTTDTVDALFTDLLEHSLSITEYTDGAFDPRIGRIVQAWGFSFRQQQEPDSTELAVGDQAEVALSAENAQVSLKGVITDITFSRKSDARTQTIEILDFGDDRYEYWQLLYDRIPSLPQSLQRDFGVVTHLWQNIAHRVARTRKK